MTTDIIRLIIFVSVLILIQGGIDYYLFRTLKKYEANYGSLITDILKIYKSVSLLMLIMLIVTNAERLMTGSNYNSGRIPQVLISIWYLPKYPIALILSVKDIIRLFRYLIAKMKVKESTNENTHIDYTRRKALHSITLGLASVPFIATAQGVLHTIYDVEVRKTEIVIPRLSSVFDGLKIVQISDIHTGSFFGVSYIEHVIEIIHQQSPDIIAITGDFVNFDPSEYERFVPLFRKLKATFGVFGSLGNHDHYMTKENHEYLISLIKKSGIDVLINESRTIEKLGASITIAGTDNTGFNQKYGDLKKAFKNAPIDSPSILMAHDPTYWSMEIKDSKLADLTLAGHTHGGQMGIEFLGTAFSPAQFVYEHWSGLYEENNTYLYVNRGLGTVGPPVRIGIKPEITVITLRTPIA
jgi:predicted MPP superfamily phosphohydrolase